MFISKNVFFNCRESGVYVSEQVTVRDVNIKIRFIETLNVFRLLKGFTTIWEGSNIVKLYSVEVCFYLTCKFLER